MKNWNPDCAAAIKASNPLAQKSVVWTRPFPEVVVLIGRYSTALVALIAFVAVLPAEVPVAPPPREKLAVAPAPREKSGPVDVAALLKMPNEASHAVKLYEIERGSLLRTYTVNAPIRTERLRKFDGDWLAALKSVSSSGSCGRNWWAPGR